MSLILRIYLHTNSLERNNESSFLACCHADAAINPFNLPKPEILPIYTVIPPTKIRSVIANDPRIN